MRSEILTCQQVFGDVLRRVRLYRHFTPEDLAVHSGVPLSRILRFENGMTEPTLSEVFLLAPALGCRACSLVEGVEVILSDAPVKAHRQNGNGGEPPSPLQSQPEHPRHEDTVK